MLVDIISGGKSICFKPALPDADSHEDISDEAAIRTGEYEYFRSGRAAELMAEYGIEPVGVGHGGTGCAAGPMRASCD